ncbi:hypothetical protein ACI6PS_07360 [Flavobacterium sp. PLA-1-15]|uniref:hypothetical protein n=1 Tax=Flavobacterium sp. PLA-1-15 TaxID=3380533 RepID=UPI003B7ECB52
MEKQKIEDLIQKMQNSISLKEMKEARNEINQTPPAPARIPSRGQNKNINQNEIIITTSLINFRI